MLRMLFPCWIGLLAGQFVIFHVENSVEGMRLPSVAYSHAGLCPNDMNPNLWVDAMSTCTRECDSDQECETFEKCCSNVCGSRSCVAARYMDATGKRAVGAPKEASCDQFTCIQQGSECHVWSGQAVCRCRDRCEREPHFTCASDGMTYYNKCYMDAEACTKGISLSVVTCRSHPTSTSPVPPGTTALPTTTLLHTTPLDVKAPVISGSPAQQSAFVGETASFLCEVAGWPKPEVTWEKQLEGRENVIMKPNSVLGNVVITNVGQLVVYSARLEDTGVYTCSATNTGGTVRAHFVLSVVERSLVDEEEPKNSTGFPAEECLKVPDISECGGEKLGWYYDSKRNSCFTFTYGKCSRNRNRFDNYELCMLSCQSELAHPCGLPSLQGPCKAYEPRWAYSGTLRQCQPFIFGGCGGNENNFESREACEDSCPFPRHHHCKPCRPRQKMVSSFCKSDFVILGRVTELTEEGDTGRALITVEEILKDEKMGLKFFQKEPLEITLQDMDWSCPCPNVTVSDAQLIVMGDAHDGMAVLRPDSFVSPLSTRRVRRLREVISKNTCDILKEFVQEGTALGPH